MSELPHIPKHWQWSTLGDLAASMTDGPFGSKLKSDHYTATGTRVIRLGNIGTGAFKNDDKSFVDPAYAASLTRHAAHGGDILIAALAEPVGRACEVPQWLGPAIVKADCIRFKPSAKILPKFLMHWMNSPGGAKNAEKHAHGVGRLRINMQEMRTLEVPLAAVHEQHRIVAEIETQFSRLDAAVASLRRVKANLKRGRASVLKAAVEGRLVPTEAALAKAEGRAYEPADKLLERILEERRRRWSESGAKGKYKEPVKPDLTAVAASPEGWTWTLLENVGTWTSGGTPSRARPDFFGGPIPWVKTGELVDRDLWGAEEGITEPAVKHSSAKVFPVGTLLVAMYGATIGMTGRLHLPAATNQACAALLPSEANTPALPYVWVYLISQRQEFRNIGQGGAQPNISQGILKGWPIALPPLAEQHRIVAEAERRLSVLDAVEATTDANLLRCERLRQSVLKMAFEGRLVPQDVNDVRP